MSAPGSSPSTGAPEPDLRRWRDALDALEQLVQRQEAFVAGTGPYPDAPWEAPPGDLPDELRPRAMLLVAACDAIESKLTAMLHARPDRVASPYR